jgi:uroporphyrinogen-III decarboxylase
MVGTGANMIEVDELSDFGQTCLACSGRASVLGLVSPSNMVFKGYKEINLEASRAIETARRAKTCLTLGAGCSMAGNTPFESIDAVIAAARESGTSTQHGKV